jgi:hypothetical protein
MHPIFVLKNGCDNMAKYCLGIFFPHEDIPISIHRKMEIQESVGKEEQKENRNPASSISALCQIAARVKAHRTHLPTATERVLESYYRPSRPTITGCKKK